MSFKLMINIGRNRRTRFRPHWFWISIIVLLFLEIVFNIVWLARSGPVNSVVLAISTPVMIFIITRMWYVIEIRGGTVSDRKLKDEEKVGESDCHD